MSERFVVKSHKMNDGLWWYVSDTHRSLDGTVKLYKNKGRAIEIMHEKNAKFGRNFRRNWTV